MTATPFTLKLLVLPLLAALALCPLTLAQDAQDAQQAPVLSVDDLRLEHFRPSHISSRDLYVAASELFGREIPVIERGGHRGHRVRNIQSLGDALVLLDEPARVDNLLERLQALDAAAARPRDDSPPTPSALQTSQWSPNHIGLRDAMAALAPFQQQIDVTSTTPFVGARQVQMVPNVSMSAELNTIVMRDTPTNVRAMTELLDSLDKPSPQFLVSALVIEGRTSDKLPHETAAPAELVQHLSQLLPFEHFVTLSTGLVQTSANADLIVLEMPAAGDAGSQLELRPLAYDSGAGSLTAQAEFQVRDGRSFRTTAAIPTGEYTVLGASGARPVFLVLRLAPQNVSFGGEEVRFGAR